MLEKVDLSRKLSKKEYKERLPRLRDRLSDLQKACWDANIPTVILFEGWDAAGKGTSINTLTQRLDPRGFKLYAIQAARTYETHMPWLWRFWLKLPNYGEMAIFDRSWYGRVLVERVEGLTPKAEWRKGYRDIANFERTIADDGYVVIKFWLHISKKEQRRRFKKLERDPLKSWHVQPEDWEHHRKYGLYLVAIEEVLERTDTEWGPWTIVEATNKRWSRVKIFETIIHRMEEALKERGFPLPEERPVEEESPEAEPVEMTIADDAPTTEEMPLVALDIDERSRATLAEAGINTVDQIIERLAEGEEALLDIDGIGPKRLEQIREAVEQLSVPEPEAGPTRAEDPAKEVDEDEDESQAQEEV
jgi:polyphosphate kinase 2 (PPK2 family)